MLYEVITVDEAPGRSLPDAPVVLDQLTGVGEIPEGVDHESARAVDESRVAPAEPAILLQAGIDVPGDS